MIGDRIRGHRDRIGLTQGELAERLGKSRVSVVNIESGKQKAPMHVYWSIAQEFGIELNALIPTSNELIENEKPIVLDENTVAEINEATQHDPKARQDLTSFIARVRNKDHER